MIEAKQKVGGPAFPTQALMNATMGGFTYNNVGTGTAYPVWTVGMSVRDWFAGQALAGLSTLLHGKESDEAARRAYQAADAMLDERAKATGAA